MSARTTALLILLLFFGCGGNAVDCDPTDVACEEEAKENTNETNDSGGGTSDPDTSSGSGGSTGSDPSYSSDCAEDADCVLNNAIGDCTEGGRCEIARCLPGSADCDGESVTGCEVHIVKDPTNCGGCSVRCMDVPNAEKSCGGGSCYVRRCETGFDDCNNRYEDGCEVDLLSDDENCGECGANCAEGLSCVEGHCQ